MTAVSDPGFPIPKDWPPLEGEINLIEQDLPHESSATEWWYLNTHLESREGNEFSVFASFFRTAHPDGRDPVTQQVDRNHSLAWGIVDCKNSQYHSHAILDPQSPDIIIQGIREGQLLVDPKIEQALVGMCERGVVPLPDRLIEGPIEIAEKGNLHLEYGTGNSFIKQADNSYILKCTSYDGVSQVELRFTPQRAPMRQGHNGIVKVGRNRETMFYYFIPRCAVEGTIEINGEKTEVFGQGWYDHEFGGNIPYKKTEEEKAAVTKRSDDEPDYAWNWFSCQLTNGHEVTATNLVDPYKKETFDNFAILMSETIRLEYESSQFKPVRKWRSCRSFMEYPVEWELTVPEIDMKLNIKAQIDDQEFMTLIARPAFWEGRVVVKGTINGEEVEGLGFVEIYGHEDLRSFQRMLKNVAKCVFAATDVAVPRAPTLSQLSELIGGEDFLEGFSEKIYTENVLKPIRDIVDRGGKSWRSYVLLCCIDAVGGDSRPWRDWLAIPELIHSGSLIIDDVQDQSQIRRGGPPVHLVYGDALAINAGSAAYFLTSMIKFPPGTPEDVKVKIYELYFQALRSGHAGQALDIYGLNYVMDDIVASGQGEKLEKMVMAIHKLKSAAPAAVCAKMGSTVGNGTPEQVEKLGRFFEALGIAFQIFDDVLNLRGFEGNLKDRGEDLAQGKVTYPVAKAMSYLKSVEEREWLWSTIKSKPQEKAVVESCIDVIEKCGALQAAANEGMQIMEDAWREVDGCIADSFFKIMLRALSYYLLDRMY